MAPIIIKVNKDGPYLITEVDAVQIVDHEGTVLERPLGKKNIALCRCGASVNKPFCDGTHSRIGFRGAEQARREFDQQGGEAGSAANGSGTAGGKAEGGSATTGGAGGGQQAK